MKTSEVARLRKKKAGRDISLTQFEYIYQNKISKELETKD